MGIDYPDYDVLLVDNHSKEASVNNIMNYLEDDEYYAYEVVDTNELSLYEKSDDLNLLFILNDSNDGFAGGNNVALNYILDNNLSDYALLLNNDTIVSNDFLKGLVDKSLESDNNGFIGINTYYYHDRNQLQTVGGGLVDLSHGEAMAITEIGQCDSFDFITGSCVLIPLSVLKDVGVIYPNFFMYWEDVDWSTIAREKGYDLKVADYGCIYHKEGASIQSLRRIYYHTANRILYMRRHTRGMAYYKFLIYIVLFVLKESFVNLIKNRQYSKALLSGLRDGIFKK